MASWGQAVILLLAIILLGIVGKNYVVAAAAGVLLRCACARRSAVPHFGKTLSMWV